MTNTPTARQESAGVRSETADYHSRVQALAAERAALLAWEAHMTDENADRVMAARSAR